MRETAKEPQNGSITFLIFSKGNKFEAEVTESLTSKYSDTFEIINFNHFDNQILVNDELGICAVPDILLKNNMAALPKSGHA